MNLTSSFIASTSGTKIRIIEWTGSKKPKAVMVFTHGYAGHAARYQNFAEAMIENGMVCLGVDLTGHGMSEGMRAYIGSFDEYIADFSTLYDYAKDKYADLPIFLFGHSMGALVVTTYILKNQPQINGAVLSGIALYVTDSVPDVLVKISTFLSKITPRLPATKLKTELTSSNTDSVKKYNTDPLIYHGGIRARTGYEFMKAAEWARGQLDQFTDPVLLMHGAEDGLANKNGSIDFHKWAGSEDKTLRVFDGLYHEILNEDSAPALLEEMNQWIDKHM